jgi:hypothetical protein
MVAGVLIGDGPAPTEAGARGGTPIGLGGLPTVNGLIRSQSQTGLTPSYHGRVIFLDIGSRAPEDIPEKTQRIALVFSGGVRPLTGFRHLPRAGSDPMMARSLPRRTRAIRLVIRTGCIPGRNTTWSEFCDLVRIAARVGETSEGLPRGWSDSSIIHSAKRIISGTAMLCERCKTEIALVCRL